MNRLEVLLGWAAAVMLGVLVLLFLPRGEEPEVEVAPEAMTQAAVADAEPEGDGEAETEAAAKKTPKKKKGSGGSSKGGGTKLTAAGGGSPAPAPAPAPVPGVAPGPVPLQTAAAGSQGTDGGANPVENVLQVPRGSEGTTEAAPAPAPGSTTAAAPAPAPAAGGQSLYRIGPDGLRAAIAAKKEPLQACYDALRGSNPDVPTRLMATLAIEPQGNVGRVVAVYFNDEAASMQGCAQAALGQLAFEPPPLRTNAGWPMDFVAN